MNAELTKGEDNISSVYSQVGSEVRSAFATPFPASATVNVSLTANYKLTNPSEKISFGGGATGEATVTASIAKHATGGIFDEPHFAIVSEAGPESIIPLDGSDHAVDLWQETGVRLGMFGGGKDTAAPLQISPVWMQKHLHLGLAVKAGSLLISILMAVEELQQVVVSRKRM